ALEQGGTVVVGRVDELAEALTRVERGGGVGQRKRRSLEDPGRDEWHGAGSVMDLLGKVALLRRGLLPVEPLRHRVGHLEEEGALVLEHRELVVAPAHGGGGGGRRILAGQGDRRADGNGGEENQTQGSHAGTPAD